MTRKYEEVDKKLLEFLATGPESITTKMILEMLQVEDLTLMRHVSKRLQYLADKSILVSTFKSNRRTSTVDVSKLPKSFYKDAEPRVLPPAVTKAPPKTKVIQAQNSEDFLLAGGKIEVIPSNWDKPANRYPPTQNYSESFSSFED